MLNYVKYFSLTGVVMDILGEKALLFDFYGALLTERQQEIYALSVDEDMSLGEIAAETGISRQAVADMLRRTGKLLQNYEAKLGLAAKFINMEQHIVNIKAMIPDNPDILSSEWDNWDKIKKEIDAIDMIERN